MSIEVVKMKHIVNLSPELEKLYAKSANYLNIPVEKILEEALEDYIQFCTCSLKKEKALN